MASETSLFKIPDVLSVKYSFVATPLVLQVSATLTSFGSLIDLQALMTLSRSADSEFAFV